MRFIILFVFIFHFAVLFGQDVDVKFFPENSIRKIILLDPVESQNSISFTRLALNDTLNEPLYIPTAIGFYKPFFQRKSSMLSEIGIDVVALSQFGVRRIEDHASYTANYQFNLLNIDFKASIIYTLNKESITYRFRLYHLSSHLGDDYLLRYGYDPNGYWMENPRNYEQFDVFMFYQSLNFDFFVGTGFVVSPKPKRDRLSFQTGLNLYYPVSKKLNVFSGLFLSLMQETNFIPSAKMSIGIDIQKEFKVLLEYYEGNMPYSAFEEIHMSYFGIGLYFSDL
jgi:Protein of unknown function (DUF1207)